MARVLHTYVPSTVYLSMTVNCSEETESRYRHWSVLVESVCNLLCRLTVNYRRCNITRFALGTDLPPTPNRPTFANPPFNVPLPVCTYATPLSEPVRPQSGQWGTTVARHRRINVDIDFDVGVRSTRLHTTTCRYTYCLVSTEQEDCDERQSSPNRLLFPTAFPAEKSRETATNASKRGGLPLANPYLRCYVQVLLHPSSKGNSAYVPQATAGSAQIYYCVRTMHTVYCTICT